MFHNAKGKGGSQVTAVIRHADGTTTNLGTLTKTPLWKRLIMKVRTHGC